MDIDYGEGKTGRVVVGTGTPVTRMVNVGVTELKPGSKVNAMTSTGKDGKSVANMIMIEPAGAQPRP